MGDDDAFLASIATDRDRAEPYLVYADVLQERGDPRGELIVVQHALETAKGVKELELRVREQELFDAAEEVWTGGVDFERTGLALQWKYGFVHRARVRAGSDAAAELVALGDVPFTRDTVVQLDFDELPSDMVLEWVVKAGVPRLHVGPPVLNAELLPPAMSLRALDGAPRLEVLSVRGRWLRLAWRQPPPKLRELTLELGDGIPPLDGAWPSLEKLVVVAHVRRAMSLLEQHDFEERFPELRSLVLRRPNEAIEPGTVGQVVISIDDDRRPLLRPRDAIAAECEAWRRVAERRSKAPRDAFVAALVDVAEQRMLRGDAAVAMRLLDRAVAHFCERGVHASARSFLQRLAGAAWARGNVVATQEVHERALALARKTGDAAAGTEAQRALVTLRSIGRELDEARATIAQVARQQREGDGPTPPGGLSTVLDLLRRLQARHDLLIGLELLVGACNDGGNQPHADRSAREAIGIARELGETAHESRLLLALADAALGDFQYVYGRRYCDDAIAMFEGLSDHAGLSAAWLRHALLDVLTGAPGDAATRFACAREHAGHLADPEAAGWIELYQAVIARDVAGVETARPKLANGGAQARRALAMAEAVLRGTKRPPPVGWHARTISRLV